MPKVNTAVLLVIIACLSSSSLGNFMLMDDGTVPAPTPNQTVSYWFACARGALQGYEQGMYKKTNWVVDPICLGPSAVNSTV